MSVYIVQHGKAVNKEENPERPLSGEGREETMRIAAYLKAKGIPLKTVYHSGKARALETAEIFSDLMGDGKIEYLEGMKPLDDAVALASKIGREDVMYVGHLPQLNKLISLLTCNREESGVISLSNSGVACLEESESGYCLKWFLLPSLCH